MTDLKNMKIDAVENLALTGHTAATHELSRRLQETIEAFDLLETAHKMSLDRTDKAESALLACQAREGELRELLGEAEHMLHHTECMTNDAMKCAACSLESRIGTALSHSTGSKIMAVVAAAKRMVESGQAGEACSEIRAYYDLDEAVRALENKND